MYQLLVKFQYENRLCYVGVSNSIAIISLFRFYHENKTRYTNLPDAKLIGYIIMNTETDEIIERFVEP